MMRPSASTKTCSARRITACITCSIISIVTPESARPRMIGTIVATSGGVEAGKHLVEQKEFGLGRERTCDLQPLATRNCEARGWTAEDIAEANRACNFRGSVERVDPRASR